MPQRFSCLVIAFAAATAGVPPFAAAESQPRLLRESYHSDSLDQDREYWLYLPAGHGDVPARRWPVLMFLHGGGERGNQLELVLRHGPIKEVVINRRDLPFIIIAPQMPDFSAEELARQDEQRRQRAEQPRERPSGRVRGRIPLGRTTTGREPRWDRLGPPEGWNKTEDDLLQMIDHSIDHYGGDEDRIYLTGLSYGGYGTWYMAMQHPGRFAAVAPICGAGDAENASQIGRLPVWLFQGGRDTVVLPEWALATADALDRAGGNVRVTVHEDLGHDSWTRVYEGRDLYDWFLSHTRSTRN